mmetsp:Transcript_122764/g.192708  ORF Transcript_122764/g.192708 Transcript_122764/m.192708 type:complete len:84 (+) Transcript_122764:3-254(+)
MDDGQTYARINDSCTSELAMDCAHHEICQKKTATDLSIWSRVKKIEARTTVLKQKNSIEQKQAPTFNCVVEVSADQDSFSTNA